MIVLRVLAVLFARVPVLLAVYIVRRRRFPRAVCQLLIALGPVYIKMGQIVSTRRELFAEAMLAELAILRDSVPIVPFARMAPALDRAFPSGIERVFSRFDRTPLAAGAVAQIYQAELPGGARVAVKVLRPRIGREIQENFRLIRRFAGLTERCSRRMRTVNLLGMVDELHALLLTQTDLSVEMRNYQEFGRLFDEREGVVIPRVYPDLTTREVLTMQFIDGIKPYDVDRLDIPRLELAQKIDSLFDAMVFLKGVCHADLHPGNFFWTRDGRIVLIDLGLVCRITREHSLHFVTFYYSILDGFYDFAAAYLARHLIRAGRGATIDPARHEPLHREIAEAIRRHFVDSGGTPNFAHIVRDLMALAIAHRLQFEAVYSKLFLTAITMEGYLYSLDPGFDMLENARQKRLDQARYTSVPVDGERLVLGDNGTYSTAMFRGGVDAQEAFALRDRHVLDVLGVQAGQLFIDVGCGRGQLLDRARGRGARAVGITISPDEAEICRSRGLECISSSWEDFEASHADFPRADAIAVIEMFNHLGNLHEAREGLVGLRLERFFDWTARRLQPGGRVFVQSLVVGEDLLHDPALRGQYERICERIPFAGFPTTEQIVTAALRRFRVVSLEDHSEDLLPTYRYLRGRVADHEAELRRVVGVELFEAVTAHANVLIEMAEAHLLGLVRVALTAAARGVSPAGRAGQDRATPLPSSQYGGIEAERPDALANDALEHARCPVPQDWFPLARRWSDATHSF